MVSTHSRAEAAAGKKLPYCIILASFNTQPRGGGCKIKCGNLPAILVSTHSRAEAAASELNVGNIGLSGFNTQPRGGGCLRLEFHYCY